MGTLDDETTAGDPAGDGGALGIRCLRCGDTFDARPVSAWIGTPPPGWGAGDPRPHVCRPAASTANGKVALIAPAGLRVAELEPARLLSADPPWPFNDALPGKGRGAAKKYKLMQIEAIKALDLPPIHDDAILLLWRPAAFAEEAFEVQKAWGFTYAHAEIIWRKFRRCVPCQGSGVDRRLDRVVPCPNCKGSGRFLHMGMGRRVRNSHETAIICTRGRGTAGRLRADVRSVFDALMPMNAEGDLVHSAKPDAFYELAASLYPGPRVALFEVQHRLGWTCFGDQLPPIDNAEPT